MYTALRVLKENDGVMPSRKLMEEVERRVNLSDWEKEITSTGGIRWQNIYHFSSVDYVKAGYIIKKSGSWYLTPEGSDVLKKNTRRSALPSTKSISHMEI